ncbi:MAG: sulfotransferase [Gluconacetobacter diazotrophicus]|nr:sulfotransferase [Gluconacetobacter diazotrophicus]
MNALFNALSNALANAPAPAAPPASVSGTEADWLSRTDRLREVATRQVFFVGGAPRSGTTWLQHLLDGHPHVSCSGEGMFAQQVAAPLDAMVRHWSGALRHKNERLFAHTGGYPSPDPAEADLLLGTAVLSALDRQLRRRPDGGGPVRAVGEKTPENVFLFPRLRTLLPGARLIAIARDPRDVIASAWHMFGRHAADGDADPAARRLGFVRDALGPMDRGAREMLRLAATDPGSCLVLTFEALHLDPDTVLARAFRFLGVADDPAIVSTCVARSAFERLSGGRARGTVAADSFLRRGEVGGWADTLNSADEALIRERLGWMFPVMGWTP